MRTVTMAERPAHDPDLQRAIEDAATWYARLLPGAAGLDAPKDTERAFARWLHADARHAHAWEIVQAMGQKMAQVPADIALPTLNRPGAERRMALRIVAGVVVGGGVLAGLRYTPLNPWQADHTTAPGERGRVPLADGGVLELDTRTALDVDYGASERAIRLHAGAILVTTAPDHAAQAARRFVVHTAHATIEALGTRFEVRTDDEASTVSVLEDAVLVHRTKRAGAPIRVQAGERLRLTRSGAESLTPAPAGVGAWTRGQLVIWDRPLAEVAAELARYRRGWLTCDPSVAGLRISGVLPITNTDEALAALEDSFPVKIERQWGGWRTRIGAVTHRQRREGALHGILPLFAQG